MNFFSHETAIIESSANVGRGSKIWQWVHVDEYAEIGENVSIGQGCYIGHAVSIGDGSRVQNSVNIYKGVVIGADVFLGPNVCFTNINVPRAFVDQREAFLKTVIADGCTLGAGTIVRCGVSVGMYAFVGAGSLLLNDLPDYSFAVGHPAKHIGWVDESGVRLPLGVELGAELILRDRCIMYRVTDSGLQIEKI